MAYTSGSPKSGLLEIGIALVLHDRFSNQAREASSQIRKLHMDAKNAINANLQAIQGIAETGLNLSMAAGQLLTNTIMDGAEFIDTMTTVRAITNATQEDFKHLQETGQSLGLRTMFDSREIASGMKYLAMAGVQSQNITEMIEGAAMVANATGMQLQGKGGSADMLTNVMRMFRLEASDAASVVGDQLTKATLSSNMSMYDLAEAIKYAGADMVTLQQSLPSVAAMIGTLGNAGIQGSMAGTAISNMARYLNKSISQPTYKGSKALAAMGLSREDFLDAKGNLLDFGDMLEKIWKASSKLTAPEVNAVFQDIFGVRGNRAAIAIARDVEGYRDLLNKVSNESGGFADSIVDQRMETIAGGIDILTSSLENLRTTFTTAVAPVITPILKHLGQAVEIVRRIFKIPIIGTFISSALVFGTLITGIISKVILLRSSYLNIFKNDNQVNTRNWFAILKGGWSGAILGAKEYLRIQSMIISQQKSDIGSSVGLMALMNNPGKWVGGYRYSVSERGNQTFWKKTGAGMTRVSPGAVPGGVVKMATPEQMVSATMGGTGGFFKGGASFFSNFNNQGKFVKKSAGSLGKVLKVGSRLLGLVGGPIGLGVTFLSFLPGIITAITDSNKAKRDNTNSTNELTKINKISTPLLEKLANASKNAEEQKLTEEMRNLANIMKYWGLQMADGMKNPTIHSTITLDGTPIHNIVENKIQEINNKQSQGLNVK